jgi:hypothetical protein
VFTEFPEDINTDESKTIYFIRNQISQLIQFGVRSFGLNMMNTSYSLVITVRFCLVFFTQDYLLDLPDCKMEFDPFNYFGFYNLPLIESSWPKTLGANNNKALSDKFDFNSTLFNLLD